MCASGLVNINTDGLTALETLDGIGPTKAQAIINYRTANGPFATIEDIQNVSGIGPTTYANIENFITVGDSAQTSDSQMVAQDTGTTTQYSDTDASSTDTSAQTQSAPEDSYVPPPLPQVFADAGGDRTVIVGADATFAARAYDRSQTPLDDVRYMWNFGDGSVAEGASVLHHYDYPGRYAVILSIADAEYSASDQIIVVAEPAALSFNLLPSGGISIGNLAGHDLNLSQWRISQGGANFTLPENSVVLSGGVMQIEKSTLGFWSNSTAELQYPNGVKVLGAGSSTPGVDAQIIAGDVVPRETQVSRSPSSPASQAVGVHVQPASPAASGSAPSSTTVATWDLVAVAESDTSVSPLWISLVGVVILLGTSVAALYFYKTQRPPEAETSVSADGFDIE